jgi:hypothetical protein
MVAATLAGGGCERELTEFEAPARPRLGQLTVCGEAALDGRFDALIRADRPARQQVRLPFTDLYEVTKKPDLFRDRAAAVVPLAAGLGREPCAGGDRSGCPGRAEWADGLRQAGIDAVSLAAPALDGAAGGSRGTTAGILADSGICATGGEEGQAPCAVALGERKVALVALRAGEDAEGRATRLVAEARGIAETVVLLLAFGGQDRPRDRIDLARKVDAAAKADLLVAHHPGPFGGVELREGRIVVHNPGALLGFEEPGSDEELAFCHRLHFGPEGPAWLEAIPLVAGAGRSRQATLKEARRAVGTLVVRSRELGTEVSDEFGRGILEVAR